MKQRYEGMILIKRNITFFVMSYLSYSSNSSRSTLIHLFYLIRLELAYISQLNHDPHMKATWRLFRVLFNLLAAS